MKTILKPNVPAILCAGLLVFASTSVAQNAQTQTLNRPQDANRAADVDDKTSGTNIRASKLIGMNIENSAQENVGEVNDLVIDARERAIRYVAVTYGGVLGIGNKMHAVPFEAFKFKADPDDLADTVLVLNVTQEQMKGATGFDENNWPDVADAEFTRNIDKRYGIDRKHEGISQAVDPTNTGVNIRDRDNSTKTPFDQNENQKDIDITANIRKRVVDAEMSVNAQNVKIITQDGHVTLRGPVHSADEKRQIEQLAQDVAGKTNVDNQLEVQP